MLKMSEQVLAECDHGYHFCQRPLRSLAKKHVRGWKMSSEEGWSGRWPRACLKGLKKGCGTNFSYWRYDTFIFWTPVRPLGGVKEEDTEMGDVVSHSGPRRANGFCRPGRGGDGIRAHDTKKEDQLALHIVPSLCPNAQGLCGVWLQKRSPSGSLSHPSSSLGHQENNCDTRWGSLPLDIHELI